jgi:hypothetical protein
VAVVVAQEGGRRDKRLAEAAAAAVLEIREREDLAQRVKATMEAREVRPTAAIALLVAAAGPAR